MSHYIANLRDIEFCLFDLLGREKVMGSNPYGEVDRDIRAEIEAGRVGCEPFHEAMIQPSSVDVRLDKFFRVFENHKYSVIDPYGEVDRDTAMGMLEEVKRLCENDLAASFVEGDRKGTDFNKATGDVKLPESFKKSYKAYIDGEWWRVDAPVELGGMKIPPSVRWAIAEMVLGQ